MQSDVNRPDEPETQKSESEQKQGRKRQHAHELFHNDTSSRMVRAWYEYEGCPYGDSEEALLRWTQEQIDKMHPE